MKCLSVRQPWAWAIVHGPKRVENRTRRTAHRGPLLIHAAQSRAFLDGTTPADWHARGLAGLPPFDELPFGDIIGVVDVTDCRGAGDVHGMAFVSGPVCWMLANPRPLARPVPWRALPGLFDVPESALR